VGEVWSPITVADARRIMEPLGVPWWIAGGWALDLHAGRRTREHEDLDIGIRWRDHLRVQAALARDWQLHKTHQPGLAPWPPGEELREPVHDVWVRRDDGSPWAFQLMLVEGQGSEWVYRRLPSIRRPLESVLARTPDGVPYLRPEVQLLYKGGSGGRRAKDLEDLRRMLPLLTAAAAAWLRDSLQRQFPAGHEWLAEIT
jgi:hypothetical protein